MTWQSTSQTVNGKTGIDQMDYYVDVDNTRFISVTTDSQANGAGGQPAALDWFTEVLNDPSTQSKDHVFGTYRNGARAVGGVLELDGVDDFADARGINDYNLAILRDLTISVKASFDSLDAGSGANTLVSYTMVLARLRGQPKTASGKSFTPRPHVG